MTVAVNDATKGDDVGVWGETRFGRGVVGLVTHAGGAGVWGASTAGRAVVGADAAGGVGVWGESNGAGVAIHGEQRDPAGFAGRFEGNVEVTGTLTAFGDIVLGNADCAEDFDVEAAADVEPGTVMVVGQGGALHPCATAYDRRVAGVVSGAGTYRPAIVLDRQRPDPARLPIALVGKTWCKVDASAEPIAMGDLLTSSSTAGHAMKATDRDLAFGAVIGKALADLDGGTGLVPILVALQ